MRIGTVEVSAYGAKMAVPLRRRLPMLIRDVMSRGVTTVHPDASLRDAANMMKTLDVGSLPVCQGHEVLGMVTDRDIAIRGVANGLDPVDGRVHDVMSGGAQWCYEDQDVSEAAAVMDDRQVRRLLVMSRDERLVGILSIGDIAITTGDERLSGRTL